MREPACQPPCDDRLLLVAAAEQPDLPIELEWSEVDAFEQVFCSPLEFPVVDEPAFRETVHRWQRHVDGDGPAWNDAFALALFGKEADACGNGRAWIATE